MNPVYGRRTTVWAAIDTDAMLLGCGCTLCCEESSSFHCFSTLGFSLPAGKGLFEGMYFFIFSAGYLAGSN